MKMGRSFLRAENKLRDDAEVAIAPAAAGLEQRMFALALVDFPLRIDHSHAYELIAGETVLPRQQAIAAAERQPADAHTRAGSRWQHATFG